MICHVLDVIELDPFLVIARTEEDIDSPELSIEFPKFNSRCRNSSCVVSLVRKQLKSKGLSDLGCV